jgi:hypothetical protein
MRTILVAAALAVAAGTASAATYDYTGGKTNPGGPTLSCDAFGILNTGCAVTYNADGLGVNGFGFGSIPDTTPDQIDGFPIGSSERLIIDFGVDTIWNKIVFGRWNAVDDLRLIWDTGTLVWGPNASNEINLGGVVSKSLTVVAYGQPPACFLFCPAPDGIGNDKFTVASIDVTPVPLPAAGWMLLAGVGGIAAIRRRRKAA